MRSKALSAFVLSIALFAFMRSPVTVSASIRVVDDDGQATATNCDASGVAYTSIQTAISAAAPGDTILVCPGVYSEQVTINTDNLTVRSFDGSAVDGTPNTIIRPGELVPAAVHIRSSGVTFQGFVVEDATASGHSHAHRGIFVQGDNNRVSNNLVRGRGMTTWSDSGILVRGGGVGNGIAEENVIEGNQVVQVHNNGILAVSVASHNAASGTIIRRNRVREIVGNGIATDRAPRTIVVGNTVEASEIGLFFNSTAALPALDSLFHCNNVVGNNIGARNDATDGRFMDARYNWWGDVRGPSGVGLGDGDPVTIGVEFAPWLVNRSVGLHCEVTAATLSGEAPAVVSLSFVSSVLATLGEEQLAQEASERNLGLVVADFESDQLVVYLGRGDGTFRRFKGYAVGDGPVALAVGDVNQDGRTDVIVANMLSDSLSVAYGRGDGTFERVVHFPVIGRRPRSVVVGDFDRDGRLDAAVANVESNDVAIFFGRVDGRLVPARIVPIVGGRRPSALVAADFNRDGTLDLAVANSFSNNVVLLIGDGQGRFVEAEAWAVGEGPVALTVADFNGDGWVDLASANANVGSVSLLLSAEGRGRFSRRDVLVGRVPLSLASGEFIGGMAGIAVANFAEGTVSLILARNARAFAPSTLLWTLTDPVSLAGGDFNNDGLLDIAVLGAVRRDPVVLVNVGGGRFQLKR